VVAFMPTMIEPMRATTQAVRRARCSTGAGDHILSLTPFRISHQVIG
jgi:hypothetical protein